LSDLSRRPQALPDLPARVERPPVLRSSLTPERLDAPGEGIPVGTYLGALRRHAWLVVGTVALCTGVAAYGISREVPMYNTTTAVRLVNTRQEMAGSLANGAAGDNASGWYTDPILSQIQLLRSRAVAADVTDSLGLRLVPTEPGFPWRVVTAARVDPAARTGDTVSLEFGAGGVQGRTRRSRAAARYGEPLRLDGVELAVSEAPAGVTSAALAIAPREDAVNALLAQLQARPREMTNVIDIGFTASDPHLAQRVVNAVARAYQRLNATSARQQSRRRHVFIQEQLGATDSMLYRAQYQLSQFRKGVQAFSSRDKYVATQEGLAGLRLRRDDMALELGVYRQMAGQLRAGRSRHGDEEVAALAASPQVASNGGIVHLYEALVRYQTQRDTITAGPWALSATHPDVIRTDSLIASARARLVRAVEARAEALSGQIAGIDRIVQDDAGRIRSLPDAEAEESRLVREVETLQKLRDDLLLEQQKARIDEAVEAGQVEVVDAAVLPAAPMGQGTHRKLLFALVAGLMLGGGGALVLDRLNTALSRREDLEEALHVPALATIPRFGAGTAPRRWAGPALPALRNRATRRSLRAPRPGGEPLPELVTVSDPHSPASQAYRKLRTHVIFSHGGPRLRTLLVASAGASEGKSTSCANLAVTFAQQHLRVLLLDCDLRRSRLHAIFGVPRSPGVPEVLLGHAALSDAIRPTVVEGLSVLPAGRLVPNASELLGSEAMANLLDEVAGRFDLVIVDTPPVLAAADAEILAVQADAVAVVVRAGRTERHAARYAVQQLRAIGARVIGAVLNDPDQKVPPDSRYAYEYEYVHDTELVGAD
jgi:capsular exopolysaccharide synthesis family protein